MGKEKVGLLKLGIQVNGCLLDICACIVAFFCPTVRKLSPIHLVEPGFVKRVRGVAHAVRVSPQFSNRMVSDASS